MIELCFRYRKLLIPYSEGELGAGAASKLERHLVTCDRCRTELDGIRLVAGALCDTDAPTIEPAGDLWARVSARIADEPVRVQSRHWFGPVRGLAAGAAAAVLVAAIGVRLLSPGTEPVVPAAKRNASANIKAPVAVKTPVAARQPSDAVETAKSAPTAKLWASKQATPKPRPVSADHQWFGSRHLVAASAAKEPRKPVEVATVVSDFSRLDSKNMGLAGRPVRANDAKNYDADGVGPVDRLIDTAPTAGAASPAKERATPVLAASPEARLGVDRVAGTFSSPDGTSYYSDAAHAAAPAAAPPASAARGDKPALDEPRGVPLGNALARASGRSGVVSGAFGGNVDLAYACNDTTTMSSTSVVDDLNETEGIRTAAIFSYP